MTDPTIAPDVDALDGWVPPARPGWLHGPDLSGWPRTRRDWARSGMWVARTVAAAVWVGAVHHWRVIYRSPIGAARVARTVHGWVACEGQQQRVRALRDAAAAAADPKLRGAARDRYAHMAGRVQARHDARAATVRWTLLTILTVSAVAGVVWPWTRWVIPAVLVHVLGAIGCVSYRPPVPGAVVIAGRPPEQRVDMPRLLHAVRAAGGSKDARSRDVTVVEDLTRERGGRYVTVDLPVPAGPVAVRTTILAAALGVGADQVIPRTHRGHAGRLTLHLMDHAPYTPGSRIPPAPLLRAGTVSAWDPCPVGYDPRGDTGHIDHATETPGGLMGAVSGAGKSAAAVGIIGWAALDPACRLWIADGGADTRPWRPIAERVVGADPDALVAMLTDLQAEMDRRIGLLPDLTRPDGTGIGVTKVTREVAAANPSAGLGLILAWVDELGLYTTSARKDTVCTLLQDLTGRCRKAGIRVWAATTELDYETVPKPVTRNLGWRWVLRCQSATQSRIVTGLTAADGWDASTLDPAKPGVGYLLGPAGGRLLRSWEYTPAQVDSIAAEAIRRREAAGTMPDPVGSIPAPRSAPDRPDRVGDGLLDRVLQVMGGRDRIHSDRLLRGLARWEEYRGWDKDRLRAALREAGVETVRSVRDDVSDGGSPVRAGVYRQAVLDALQAARV